ncbi:MAG: TonB-dependent receptor plug domain-containing protein [Prevotella sp.]|nr:TonB-dependent receptor plug domain-containing protein [Prevotella sp.]
MRKTLLFLLLATATLAAHAQTGNLLYDRIIRQIRLLPQEKTYLFTDAETYQAGQRISMRAFLVNAVTHQRATESRYVYVELISPDGIVLRRIRLLRGEDGFTGWVDLPSDSAKGRYVLRAYTRNMENTDGYESMKSIFVGAHGRLLPMTGTRRPQPDNEWLQASRTDSHITVSLATTASEGKYHLLGHCRSLPFLFGDIRPGQSVTLREDSLPQGVLSFLLLDDAFHAKAELPVISNRGQERCRLTISKGTPDETDGTIRCTVTAPTLREGETLDIAIRAERDTADEPDAHSNILSHLLLDADMAGNVEEPATMLSPQAADTLLRHSRWTRYDMASVVRGSYRRPKTAPELTGLIRGKVETLVTHKPVTDATVNLISPNRGFYAVARTDGEGHFCFDGIDFPEGTQYVLNAFNKDGKPWVSLRLEEETFPQLPARLPAYTWADDRPLPLDTTLADMGGTIRLDEVSIVSHRPTSAARSDTYAQLADFSFGLREIEQISATCLHELIRRIPGARVEHDQCYIRGAVSIRAKMPAAIAVDGVFLEGDYDLDNIQMADVERVDVFKTGSTVIWGARGGAGVISITTKKGEFRPTSTPRSNTKTFTQTGYQLPAPFVPNARSLFWCPSLRGTSLTFTLPSTCQSSCRIVIEGVTSEGRLIHEVID